MKKTISLCKITDSEEHKLSRDRSFRGFSRRDFVRSTLVSLGVLLLAGCVDEEKDSLNSFRTDTPTRESQSLRESQSFYVDFTNGHDDNSGLSPDEAWKTISKVNNTSFITGDKILFKCGETWIGTCLTVPSDGLTFGDYGDGNKPYIDGNHEQNCIEVKNKSNLHFENLELSKGLDACAMFINCSNIEIVNCDMHEAGNDNLIFISNCSNCTVKGGKIYNPYQRAGDVLVTCIEIADGGSDFIVSGVECYGSANAGISIHNHSSDNPQGITDIPTRVVLENVFCHDNAQNGLNIMAQDNSVTPVITVSNSSFISNEIGIRLIKTENSTYYPQGVSIINCIVLNNSKYGIYINADDCMIQHCVFSGTSQQNKVNNAKRIKFYNNTISLTPNDASWPFYVLGGQRNEGLEFVNNIIYLGNSNGQVIGFAADSTMNCVVNNNIYWFPSYEGQKRWMWNGAPYTYSDWKIIAGNDSNSPEIVDPLFSDISKNDFSLKAGSPAINVGVNVGLPFLGSAPDLGAFERE